MSDNFEIKLEKDNKYQIIFDFIKDISFEIPSIEAFTDATQNLNKYENTINLSTKNIKDQLYELNCVFTIKPPETFNNKIYAEICLAIIFKLLEPKISQNEFKKITLAEIPNFYSKKIKKIIEEIFRQSGFNNFSLNKEINFIELFENQNK